jgi:phosphatidate phosphatase LPIN
MKFFDTAKSVYDYFSDISIIQATLSGSIDIIVVEQPDKSLKSTPFHVRFGKYKTLTYKEKIFKIKINTFEMEQLEMKLGKAGEG